jgi:hypothetical protein
MMALLSVHWVADDLGRREFYSFFVK